MQRLKLLTVTVVLPCCIWACLGNSSATNSKGDKQNTPSDPASGSTGGSGKDMFYEYKLTTSGRNLSIQSDTKMYVSSKGDMRVEMDMSNTFMGNKHPERMVIIGHSDKPNESISIDDSAKTYCVNQFSDKDFNTEDKIKSTVTKIGEEKILGFNSVHARIISNKTIGSFYSNTDTVDIWKSKDVPMLASIKDLMEKFEARTGNMMYSTDAVNQLKQMGCEGFMTKMEIHSKRSSTKEELVKAEHRDLPASMFHVPAGYKESKSDM